VGRAAQTPNRIRARRGRTGEEQPRQLVARMRSRRHREGEPAAAAGGEGGGGAAGGGEGGGAAGATLCDPYGEEMSGGEKKNHL